MKDLLITHTDLDGISPIILMTLTNREFEYKNVEISEIDETFDELFSNNIKDYENIYVVDLTLTPHAYELLDTLDNVLVFDHHESHLWANEKNYVNVTVDIDGIQTCGTELFYNYLITKYELLKKDNVKEYVTYVRELDTYNFTSEMPKQIEEIRKAYGKTDFIKTIVKRLKKDKPFELTAFEKRLLKLKKAELEKYIFRKNLKLATYNINGLKCGIVFCESYKSELGNQLNLLHPELDMIIMIDSSSSISYRSIKDDAKVNILAESLGGGGHKKASGSPITDDDRNKIIELLIKKNENKIEKITEE